jgi:hypothetical protein
MKVYTGEDNIKTNVKEIGWEGLDSIDLRLGTSGELL